MSDSSEFKELEVNLHEGEDVLQDDSEQSSLSSDTSSEYNDSTSHEKIEKTSVYQITLERTLAIVKPDAMDKATEIEDLIMRKGFMILQKRKIHLTPEQASDFYSEHYGKMFFPSLIANISSGPILVMVLGKNNAVKDWNETMGHANPFKARDYQPQTLRAIYGKDHTRNAVHGSDNMKSAEREIGFLFSGNILEPISTQQSAKDYVTKQVQPTLLHGLTALCKQKPVDPITWLADWLIENNPRKPKVNSE
ncbi:nucleoside diphosphate kinase homolog 5-like [Styela clava]|uniref:nucleoside diphosphate kinase homolog 5-like n=1 Tax=Styela clava TaxID=7725 RepID=UPI00193A3B43|nr:nucleoside diphosphate kinase homolog 5-like [Styela clava]